MKRLSTVVLVIALVFVSANAFAFTASGNMSVTANVINACTMTVGSMIFGNYTSGAAMPAVDASTTVDVTCDTGVSYTIDANGGSNYASPDRQLLNGASNYLKYNLFTDAARTQVWGSAIGGAASASIIGTGAAQPYTVYGRIWASQVIPAGAYSDTVSVTVNW